MLLLFERWTGPKVSLSSFKPSVTKTAQGCNIESHYHSSWNIMKQDKQSALLLFREEYVSSPTITPLMI